MHMYEAALMPSGQGHPRMVSFPRRGLCSLFVEGGRPRRLEMCVYTAFRDLQPPQGVCPFTNIMYVV